MSNEQLNYGTIDRDSVVSGKYYKSIHHMDIEVFPHWWSIIFTYKTKKIEFTSDNNDISQLIKIIKQNIITAFNGKGYDFKILYAIAAGLNPELIYELSQAIIQNDGESDNPLLSKYLKSTYWGDFNFIDLIDDMTGSLKEHESNMGMKILESTVPFGKENLTDDDKKELLIYNHHDVVAQVKLFENRVDGYLLPKIVLSEMYDLHPIKSLKDSNANLTAKILGAKRLPKHMLIDKPYKIPNHIADYVCKFVPEDIIEAYLTTGMNEVNKKDMKVNDFGNKGKLGKGGIHTVMREYMKVTNKNCRLILIDVASYYPNLMIWFDFLSRAVEDKTIFPLIYDRRKEAKLIKDKSMDKALKLILNTTFGAMGQKFNALFDPNNAWSVTITGQLLLYALTKNLWLNAGCKIIQTNTDGTLVGVKDENYDKVVKLVDEWQDMTKLQMDYDEIEVFAQANVNNYACKFTNGKTKVKGALCMQALTCDESAFEVVTWNNWDMRIVHEAVFRYLIYKEPVEQTIMKCKDLKMFISTCKTGGTYSHTYQYIDGKEIEIQKVNRVIATNNKRYGTLKKFKITKGRKPRGVPNKDWNYLLNKLESLMRKYDFNIKDRNESIKKMKLINDKLMSLDYDIKYLKAICLREEYGKVPKISEHSYILNKDMSVYKWDKWESRIDFDFYIKVAKDKLKGWCKK